MWRPKMIKAEILPYDNCEINDLLNQLLDRDFIRSYTVGEKQYGYIPSFSEEQNPHKREADTKIPAPPKENPPYHNGAPLEDDTQPRHDLGTTKDRPRHDLGTEEDVPRHGGARLIPDSLYSLSSEEDKHRSDAPLSKHFTQNIEGKYLTPLLEICKKLREQSNGEKSFNAYQWVQIQIRKKSHPGAILKALLGLHEYWEGTKNPRGYVDSIIKVESKNFNEREHIEAHEAMKMEWQQWETSDEGRKMAELFDKAKPRGP